MTVQQTISEIVEEQGVLVGPYRRPRNMSADVRGSIHDDATAQNLGFRGGTVAGSIHMEQFPPVLMRAFGERWFEKGGLSTYFRNATTDSEPVRPYVRLPEPGASDTQVKVWMERDDGMQVLEGTASIGAPSERSMLREVLTKPPKGKDLRILGHLEEGSELPSVPTSLSTEEATQRIDVMTEPLDWYRGASPWGGPIAHPGLVVHMMRNVERGLELRRNPAVGLFGAIEVRHIDGPVFLERNYDVSGKVLMLGETPKSEYVWYESMLTEPDGGREVASMIMMLRLMKGSSKLWREA